MLIYQCQMYYDARISKNNVPTTDSGTHLAGTINFVDMPGISHRMPYFWYALCLYAYFIMPNGISVTIYYVGGFIMDFVTFPYTMLNEMLMN